MEDVREFFHAFYRPDNATMVLVGDFSADEAARMAQQYFGGIQRPKEKIVRINTPEPPQTTERRLTKSYDNTPLPGVMDGLPYPGEFCAGFLPAGYRVVHSVRRAEQHAVSQTGVRGPFGHTGLGGRETSPKIRIFSLPARS